MAERRPVRGKKSKVLPGDPVILHGRVLEVTEADGKSVVVCSISGWPVTGGRVYVAEQYVDLDPAPPG